MVSYVSLYFLNNFKAPQEVSCEDDDANADVVIMLLEKEPQQKQKV